MDLALAPSQVISAGVLGAIPYLATMVVMITIQYVQQWYTQRDQVSVAGERQQRQMQMFTRIMPLFLGFISWNFPAGLLLYWTTSNLVRLGQQIAINWMDGRPEPPARARQGGQAGFGRLHILLPTALPFGEEI